MNIAAGVSLTIQVLRDSGPLGGTFGRINGVTVADVSGDFAPSVAAALLRGIADALDGTRP